MIKVLHVITSLGTGGAEMMLFKLVEGSDRRRFEHRVVSLVAPGRVGRGIRDLGIPVQSLDMSRGLPDPRGIARLRSLLNEAAPDLLQTWLYHADLLGLLAAAALGIPVAWNIRGTYHHDLGSQVTAVVRACALLSRFPTAIVTNSETARRVHIDLGYRPSAWQVIPNGFDVSRFAPNPAARRSVRADLGLPDTAPLIGSVARYHPMKDHANFLRAANLLRRDRRDARFVLIGDQVAAENMSLRALVDENDLHECVYLLGARSDIPRLTAALDIATSSSRYGEGFPNSVGEAMACGVPCVVTDVGDSARIVADTGRVVPPANPGALADAWREMLDLGEEGRRALGRQARARVVQHYGLDAVVRQYEMFYEQIAAKTKPASTMRT
jgi:glycosyltransferase involved in cell wall biosynthesis